LHCWTYTLVLLRIGTTENSLDNLSCITEVLVPCCCADREFYSCNTFQWTIAWSLGYQTYRSSLSSIQTGPICVILLVQQNCPANYQKLLFWYMMGKMNNAIVLSMIFSGNLCTIDVEPCLLNCAQSYRLEWFQWEIAWLLVGTSSVGSDIIQCGLQLIQWRIAWSLSLECLDVGNHSWQLIPDAIVTYLTPHGNPNRLGDDRSCFGINTSKMMPWEIASPTNDILTYTTRVLISWDPGGSGSIDPTAWNITQLQLSRLTWTPVDVHDNGLRASRILRRGNCQRPVYKGWAMGRHIGPWSGWKQDAEGTEAYIRRE